MRAPGSLPLVPSCCWSVCSYWYDPGGDAWAVFESLDLLLVGAAVCGLLAVAPRFGTGGLGRALPLISVAAFAIVLVQLIDPPPVVSHSSLATGAWLALAATATMALGAILGAASISVTVDVRGRERRRRTAAIDARESAAEAAEAAAPSEPGRPGVASRGATSRCSSRASRSSPSPRRIRSARRPSTRSSRHRSDERRRQRAELRGPALHRRPVSAEVALLELEGRFRAETRRRLGVPRLMAESDDGSREVAPAAASEAQAEPDGGLWRASYAVALEVLDDGSFALAVGRELLVGLPAPDLAETSGEREVRLAREANALRRTADEARAAAAAALASVGTERQAREATEAEIADARMARDDHARRAASLDDDLAQLRREHAAELVRRDEEQAAALAGRDEEAAQAAEERVAELEAEAAEARRSLRAARAEAEAMRRDLERERERAEAAEAAVRRGRVTELDGEPVQAGDADDDRPRPWSPPTATRPWPPRAPRPTRTTPTSSIPRRRAGDRGRRTAAGGARPATTAARTPPRSPPASAPSPSRATPARPSACSARGARGAPARAPPPTPPPARRPSAPATSSPARRPGAARPPPGWRASWPSQR